MKKIGIKLMRNLNTACGLFALCFIALASAQEKPPEQTWTVNFKDTDILEVVKFVGEVTGKTIIVDPKVRGPIKVISQKQLNKKELYALFLAVLDVHGFTAVESSGVVRVIANRDARERGGSTEDVIKDGDDGYVTQIIQLNNISAGKMMASIRALVPQYAYLAAYEPSNSLIITDTRANILRVRKLIEQMDRGAVIATEVVPLKFAQASEVVNMITQLEKPDPNRGLTSAPPIFVADKRINAIIISGDEMSRQRLKTLVADLDKPQTRNSNLRVVYLKYAKSADVAKILTAMLQSQTQGKTPDSSMPGGTANVQSDEATNSVLITADNDTYQSLKSVVDSLDIRRAQVLVEAIIVEVQGSLNKQLGLQWLVADNKSGFGGSSDGGTSGAQMAALGNAAALAKYGTTSDIKDKGTADLAAGIAGLAGQTYGIAYMGTQTSFMGLLRMLQTQGDTNVLSTPNLLTTDNTKASISIGQKVPFKTGSYSGTTGTTGTSTFSNPFNTINRESVGIKLEVTPHINEGDSIILDIKQEVSGISDKNNPDGPITDERKIDTQIVTANGQTAVLGGLIKDDVQVGSTRVPFLGSIPVLGSLFRSQTNTKTKVNLLVFIRATIIRDDAMLEGATAEKYRAIRDAQLKNRDKQSDIFIDKSIPVLPAWKDAALPEEKLKSLDATRANTKASDTKNPAEPSATTETKNTPEVSPTINATLPSVEHPVVAPAPADAAAKKSGE